MRLVYAHRLSVSSYGRLPFWSGSKKHNGTKVTYPYLDKCSNIVEREEKEARTDNNPHYNEGSRAPSKARHQDF